ncbi:Rho GTPase-activating protein [Exophiala dermatitidis]|uniref:Myosin IX n=2 Tax=Exophiala dermatitidis TaxID=5970 RepID=H6BQG4_EXODN|nr:myosin IX [Exophiala dermatitidis NIH/UT8656]KAJ4511640.1 Rho GTPase-activating protein [Exophiala dermatitidis]EHY54557.1 myosin IX [Exophiala dermatitidis NIH/UT8656]KAJ4517716.1 Rho GTPase-activating protein [Exophiala dermatitidis]KAJ4521373.1 Rho GTPase-activating protein [Exophiala dermatitidis]KAJ4542044.1 Rho GTPase-activating protein [Exophiala dermatitidis]
MATAVEPTSPVDGPRSPDPTTPKTSRDNELPLPPVPPLAGPSNGVPDPADRERLQHILSSDIGITTLLGRLKQSIASTREFAAFLKERSVLEEKHAQGLKRLSRSTHDQIRRPENRQGSFAQNYEEITRIHDRMADHGLLFANTLYAMSEELSELAANTERARKHWKQTGLNAEKRFQDAEAAMEKAKAKYNSLAEQYDRARTGEKQPGRFGIKGTKSAVQQEEDLHRKLEAADGDYASKVQAAQTIQQELLHTYRPQTVNALQDLIREIDAGVGVQMQKFAGQTEKLILGYGLSITPLKGQSPASRSLREVASSVDNERDLLEYVLSFSGKASSAPKDIKYEKHPALSPKQQQLNSPFNQPPAADPYGQSYAPQHHGRQVSGAAPYQGDGYPGPGPQHQQQYVIGGGTGPSSGYGPPPRPPPPPAQQFFERDEPRSEPPSEPPQLPQIDTLGTDRFAGQTSGTVSTGQPDRHYHPPPAQVTGTSGQPAVSEFEKSNFRSPVSSIEPEHPLPQQYGHLPPGPNTVDQRTPSGYSAQSPNDPIGSRPPRGSSLERPSDYGYKEPRLRGQSQPATVFSQVTVPHSPETSAPAERPGAGIQGEGSRSFGSGHGAPPGFPRAEPGPGSAGIPSQRPPQGSLGAAPWAQHPVSGGSVASPTSRGPSGQRHGPPVKPVFGVSLDELFQREGAAVPAIVRQCIQAVDLYGLDVEGIYRTSGSAHHIMELRQLFDHDATSVDFRNAAAFYNDIASVTTLLKHFLRELPDPLLTAAQYHAFIEAAKLEDDIVRRDSIHALVNSLPDPNYATLRALTLHLYRVAQHSDRNKMTISNLAIVFAPTLMGQHGPGGANGGSGPDIADAGWQAKVVETILNHTYQIFDDDE